MNDSVYLDYNATGILRNAIKAAVLEAHDAPLNASAVHKFGRQGRKLVEDARKTIADAIGCPAEQLVFNSGATEGNNTVYQHFRSTYISEQILIGATEHPSVIDIEENSIQIPVDNNGLVDLKALEELLQTKTSLVSVMIANNETGVIQPIKEISSLIHKHGALLHCDGTQALGRIPVDMQAMGIDFLTLSAHKVGGPQGVGALALGLCGITPILLHGGGQERKARAGTENVAGIAGFGAAVEDALSNMDEETAKLKSLQQHLEDNIIQISPEAVIHSQATARLPNTTFVSLPGLTSESMLMHFDLEGIAVSNGSACSSGTVKESHVLRAMNAPEPLRRSVIRISTGWATKAEDIDRFIAAWQKLYERNKDKITNA